MLEGLFLPDYGSLPGSQPTPLIAACYAITRLGTEAVIVFFVLSGFLVGGRTTQRMIHRTFILSDYIIDRFARIYIPFIPALFFSWVCASIIERPTSFKILFLNIISLQGMFVDTFADNAPLWSLAYEAWFYILLGSLGAMTSNRLITRLVGGLLFFICGIIFSRVNSVFLWCWLAGLIAYFYKPPQPKIYIGFAGGLLSVIAIMGIQLNIRSSAVDASAIFEWLPALSSFQLLLAFGVAIGVTQLQLLTPRTLFWRSLDAIGTKLAAFSYTLYLIHYPILSVLQKYILPRRSSLDWNSVLESVAAVLFTIGVAWLWYLLFERNTPQIKALIRNWFQKSSQKS